MSDSPVIVAEVTAADWTAAGSGWTHLPYLARFRADRLPASWEAFFTGRHHAVLESGRTGSLTIAVPAAPRATLFFADGRVVLHAEDGAHEEAAEKPLAYLRRWSREVRAPRLAGWRFTPRAVLTDPRRVPFRLAPRPSLDLLGAPISARHEAYA